MSDSVMETVVKSPSPLASPPRAPTGPRLLGTSGTVLLGGLLVGGCLVVQLLWLLPPYPSDQINYLQAAATFPSAPRIEALDHQYLRYGLVVPLRLAIEVFGYSQATYYVVPVLSGLLLVLSVYALGVMWFGRLVGLLAALVVAGNSIVFEDLSMPLPDLSATALVTAAIVLAVAIRRRRPWAAGTGLRCAGWLSAIGLLLAGSYLCREFVVFIWPLVGLLLLKRIRLRDTAWLVAPIVVLVAAESTINAIVLDDPLARLHAAAEHGSGPAPAHIGPTFQDRPAIHYLVRLPGVLHHAHEGPFLVGMLVATIVGGSIAVASLITKHRLTPSGGDPRARRLCLLLVWILLLWMPLTLLGGLLNPAHPKLRLQLDRYWFPIFPPVILGGIAVAWLIGEPIARWILTASRSARVTALTSKIPAMAALAVAVPPLVIAASGWVDNPAYRVNGATQLEDLRGWLADHDDVPVIWADRRTSTLVPVFTRGPFGGTVWHGEVRTLLGAGPRPLPGRNEHVVLYSAESQMCAHCRLVERKLFGDPVRLPVTWTRVYRTPDGILQIYRVN